MLTVGFTLTVSRLLGLPCHEENIRKREDRVYKLLHLITSVSSPGWRTVLAETIL